MIEDIIQEAIKPIITLYQQIEIDLVLKLANHFNINQEFSNASYWYLKKLEDMGGFNNEVIKLLETYTGKTKEELLKAMKEISINSIPIDQLNIAKEKNELLNPQLIKESTVIQNIIKHSYNEVEKSFIQLNKTIAESVRNQYKDIITKAYIETSGGFKSLNETLLESMDSLGDKGITLISYETKAGIRNYNIEGLVRRDLLMATRGLASKVNEEVIKESGNHIVRVSHHFGARTGDGGENYTNHAWWQEKQFFCWNYDGKATEEEKKLPDFKEHCNYGDVQGIVGINCKHFFTVWYGSLEKDKLDFTYEENEEQYKKTQQQRYLENGVRKWKRKQVIAKKVQDEEGYKKASIKAKEWQDKLKTFSDENELKRDYTREHIKGYKNVTIKDKDDIILLPNYQDAIIPQEKFTQYALNPLKDRNKAEAFERALGYNLSNSDKLIENIRNNIANFNAKEKEDTGYGKRYEIIMTLLGENNKYANVKTAWIIDKETKQTRLTSAYVTSKKLKEGNNSENKNV